MFGQDRGLCMVCKRLFLGIPVEMNCVHFWFNVFQYDESLPGNSVILACYVLSSVTIPVDNDADEDEEDTIPGHYK